MDYKIEINPDDLPFIREKLMKCKIIVLNGMDKHPLQNPKYFSKQDRNELLKKVRDLFDTKSIDEITEEFNTICNERLFDSGIDYSNFPIYVDKRFPIQQQKIDDEEPALEKLKEDIKENKLIVQDIAGNILEIDNQE
jgi:hypothetical protein